MAKPDTAPRAVWLATVACAIMIAHLIGGKAVRDALFLTSFPVTALPKMVIGASVFSIVSVLAASRAMSLFTPWRLVPFAYAASAALQMAVWWALPKFPRECAVLEYLLIVGLGALLLSGFWSLVNERFDPQTAKKHVGQIAGAGTLGGMIGGVLAERVGAMMSVGAILPLLAAYHLACAVLLTLFGQTREQHPEPEPAVEEAAASGWRVLVEVPYLRTVAILVLLGTVSAGMLDYVFKYQASTYYGKGAHLVRFFAVFYSAVGVLSFVLQAGFSRLALQKLGMAKTIGTLPLAVTAGGGIALLAPGIGSATIARALEAVFRGSLFRAGYELFYLPMPKREKRAAKPIVDVGFDRLGDAVGSLLVTALLTLGAAVAPTAILGGAIAVALAGLWIASKLQNAYIGALEHGLLEQGENLTLPDFGDSLAFTGMIESFTIPGRRVAETRSPGPTTSPTPREVPKSKPDQPGLPPQTITGTGMSDPVVQLIMSLRSGQEARVRQALASAQPLPAFLVSHVVQLLAWEKLYPDALRALRATVERHGGQLVDMLLDQDTEFTVRRRIPRVLQESTRAWAVEGLLAGLQDRRFEVRYQCARALSAMKSKNPDLALPEDRVFAALGHEVAVTRNVWESHRLLDRSEEADSGPFPDASKASRSLEHVFHLLSLTLPTEPLRIAFHGLHSEDAQLRGTALEYLDSVLPEDSRQKLWLLIEQADRAASAKEARPREVVIEELLKSQQSIHKDQVKAES